MVNEIITEKFKSDILNNERDIYILLPPGYHASEAKYPVLYMNDGQNIFSTVGNWHKKWNVDIVMQRLYEERAVPEMIIVGITHLCKREYEFTPTYDALVENGGGSQKYLQFITDELKPFLEKKYRILGDRANTAIMGSSLGGILTLEAARTRFDAFSKFGALSSSFWWDFGIMLEYARNWNMAASKDVKLWIDMGLQEGGGSYLIDDTLKEIYNPVNFCRVFVNILMKKGYSLNENLKYVEDPNGIHDEICWGRRFYDIMKFLFASSSSSVFESKDKPKDEKKDEKK